MGKNKLGKFADLREWSNVYEFAQAEYASQDHPLRGHWASEVFGNSHPIVLELGCGKGEYAVGLAERYPDRNFIGIDIKGARMWTGAGQALQKQLTNVVFLRTHIEFLPHFFAPSEVSEIWLTFPDPQMKKTRKRLTSTRFMLDYAQMLEVGGLIHLKTDSHFMATYTEAMIEVNRLPLLYRTDDLYRDGFVKDGEGRLLETPEAAVPDIQTFYEKQWLQRGLSIKYLRFSIPDALRQTAAWVEPEVDIEPDDYRSFGRSARWIEGHVEPRP